MSPTSSPSPATLLTNSVRWTLLAAASAIALLTALLGCSLMASLARRHQRTKCHHRRSKKDNRPGNAASGATRRSHGQNRSATITRAKAAVKTPAEAAAQIPLILPPLPEPLTITFPAAISEPVASATEPRRAATSAKSSSPANTSEPETPTSPGPAAATADQLSASATASDGTAAADPATTGTAQAGPAATTTIPEADLQPLYNDIQDCRICQAKLAAATADLAAERQRISPNHRTQRSNKSRTQQQLLDRTKEQRQWLLLGAAVGA